MKMVEADKYTYGKVELVEETRQLDSVYFRKLQALHQESVSKKNESTVADTDLPSFPDVLKEAQHLHQASKNWQVLIVWPVPQQREVRTSSGFFLMSILLEWISCAG